MNDLPSQHILTIKPKEYLQQGPSHCGVYSVKGILSAYGKDVMCHPKEYHPNKIGKLTGMTLGKKYYVQILKTFGIKSEVKTAEVLLDKNKLILLKKLLLENTPVMIRIGNGYLNDKYNPVIGRLQGHWITLWGYNDNKKMFYTYDSGLSEKYWNKSLPVGNTVRTYNEILRDWNFGRWQPWTWPFTGIANNLYIRIIK